jgi:2,5-furandicarboxylate decarboxylase 1
MNMAQGLYRAKPWRQESNAVPHATTPEPVLRNAPEPIRTLRHWLDHLEKHDRLAVIHPRARLQHEIAAIAKRVDGEKATVFPRPDGHAIPVISGLISDRRWMAEAMGVEPHEVLTRFQEAALNTIPWQEVKDAPAQEIVETNVDLSRLPIPVHNEHDNGAYITAGLLIARNPRTGVQNVSIHRLQVSGPNRLGALLLPRHTHMFYEMAGRAAASRNCDRRQSTDAARFAGDLSARLRRIDHRRCAARATLAGRQM